MERAQAGEEVVIGAPASQQLDLRQIMVNAGTPQRAQASELTAFLLPLMRWLSRQNELAELICGECYRQIASQPGDSYSCCAEWNQNLSD